MGHEGFGAVNTIHEFSVITTHTLGEYIHPVNIVNTIVFTIFTGGEARE